MSKKAHRTLKESQKEFVKIFSALCQSKSAWQVWNDFITCAAVAISNRLEPNRKRWQKREDVYMAIIRSYAGEEKAMPELLAITATALEDDPEQDYLGEMFMALEMGSHWHGQFFTPYSICRLMAKVSCGTVGDRPWISVNDPACGAGALLIAARNQYNDAGVGYDRVLFTAQDINSTAGLMCYIQLSLLGCAGYVCIADTICNPCMCIDGRGLIPAEKEGQDIWYTPAYYTDIWITRQFFARIGMRNGKLSEEKPMPAELAAEKLEVKPIPVAPVLETPEPKPMPVAEPGICQQVLFG